MKTSTFAHSAVQNAAEAIAAALHVDVTVVDSRLLRLAGTGPYRDLVGGVLHPDSAFGQALRTGTPVTVTEPRVDQLCSKCRVSKDCRETAHIVTPILNRQEVVGVFGLVAFDQAHKDWLLSQRALYSEFIEKMSELLGSKLVEERMMAEVLEAKGNLDAVVNAVREGIVAVNVRGEASVVNAAAHRLLIMPANTPPFGLPVQLGAMVDEVLRSGEGFMNQERQFSLATGSVHLMTSINPIQSGGQVTGAVVTLQDMRDVQDLVYRMSDVENKLTLQSIIGGSPSLTAALNQARQAAKGNATVLIVGESGTGKELFARGIHAASPRRLKPFVAINCAAIPEELLESELFGYVEGAFTGARKGGKPGKFELANHGTLFLDEIGDLSLRLQAKLLRVLQEGDITRVGATETTQLDVRIIVATHRNLESMMQKAEFREDLYYRLCVIPIEVPPLRSRKEDLPLLIHHFCQRYERLPGQAPISFGPDALALLINWDWPGNVRELQNAVEYAANMATEVPIPAHCLPRRLQEAGRSSTGLALRTLEDVERDLLAQGLQIFGRTDAGKQQLAKALGIGRATVYRKLRKHGLLSQK